MDQDCRLERFTCRRSTGFTRNRSRGSEAANSALALHSLCAASSAGIDASCDASYYSATISYPTQVPLSGIRMVTRVYFFPCFASASPRDTARTRATISTASPKGDADASSMVFPEKILHIHISLFKLSIISSNHER